MPGLVAAHTGWDIEYSATEYRKGTVKKSLNILSMSNPGY